MSKIFVYKNTILTILSKSAILLLNFLIVIYITRFWGAEGKGYQAIFMANLSLIAIFMNIFTNSSIAFFVGKVGPSKLYAQACLWTFISSSLGVLLCYFFDNNSLLLFLFVASILTGYLTFHQALYIGLQKIKYFNLLTILQPSLLLFFMVLLYQTKVEESYFAYFYAYIFSLAGVIIIAYLFTRKIVGDIKLKFDFQVSKQTFKYGFQNELSNFFHFFVTRLSFYFIIYYLNEVSLGIFSVGIAISESILIISKSISMVQYSKIVGEGNTVNAKKGVVTASFFSIILSFVCLSIILLLPKSVYGYIFTNEFLNIKQIILLMSPGILANAFSSVYGHFFAAIGKLKILVIKSVVGASLTFILSIFLIPLWQMKGACITNSITHIVGSLIIMVSFLSPYAKLRKTCVQNRNQH